jgi:hypothetical protein
MDNHSNTRRFGSTSFWVWTSLGIIVALGIVCFALQFLAVWTANRHLCDLDWLARVSSDSRRDCAHTVVAAPFGNYHDAFLILENDGDVSSIPILISALKRYPSTGPIPCERDHCLDALRTLSGHDAGKSYHDWITWWEKSQSPQ